MKIMNNEFKIIIQKTKESKEPKFLILLHQYLAKRARDLKDEDRKSCF